MDDDSPNDVSLRIEFRCEDNSWQAVPDAETLIGQALRLAGDTMSRIAGALLGAPETRLVGVALQLQIDEIEGRTPVAVVQELRRLFRRTESALTGAHAIASRLHVGAGSDARS